NSTPLTLEFLNKCSNSVNSDQLTGIMKEILGNLPLDWLSLQRETMKEDNWEYSVKVSGNPKISNQENGGTCWIHASLNYLRRLLMQKYSIDHKFELSSGYVHFYDKIERANLFLEYIWTFRDRDFQD